jgi:hypothetical protein
MPLNPGSAGILAGTGIASSKTPAGKDAGAPGRGWFMEGFHFHCTGHQADELTGTFRLLPSTYNGRPSTINLPAINRSSEEDA